MPRFLEILHEPPDGGISGVQQLAFEPRVTGSSHHDFLRLSPPRRSRSSTSTPTAFAWSLFRSKSRTVMPDTDAQAEYKRERWGEVPAAPEGKAYVQPTRLWLKDQLTPKTSVKQGRVRFSPTGV